MAELVLPRPESTPAPAPSTSSSGTWSRRTSGDLVKKHPILATYVGLHDADDRLDDATRDAVEQEIADAHRMERDIEAIDPAGLSESVRLERELALHNVRRELFDMEVHRVWERRSTAMDAVGDAMFAVFARDFAPLAERLASLTARTGRRSQPARAAPDPRHRAAGPPLAGAGDRRGRADAGLLRRDQSSRSRGSG